MRVNLSPNLPNSPVEAASKPAEKTENGLASAFFAQMDQIWNKGGEKGSPNEDKSGVDQAAEKTADPMSLPPGTSLVSAGTVGIGPNPSLNLTGVAARPFGNADSRGCNDSEDENKDVVSPHPSSDLLIASQTTGAPAAPTVAETEARRTKAPDPLEEIAGADLKSPVLDFPSVSSDSSVFHRVLRGASSQNKNLETSFIRHSDSGIPKWLTLLPGSGIRPMPSESILSYRTESSPVPDVLGTTDSIRLFGNSSLQNVEGQTTVPKKADTVLPEASERSGRGNTQSVLEATMQGKLESTFPEPAVSFALPVESRYVSRSASESSSAAEKLDSAEGLLIPQSPDTRGEIARTAVPKEFESAVREDFRKSGTGSDAGAPRDESASGAVPQSRLDSPLPDAVRTRASVASRSQDAPAQFLSSNARTPELNHPVGSNAVEAPPSQPREFVFQLAERIQVQIRVGKGEIRIQLKPDSLGRLEIKAETTSAGVVARITTESGNVKSYLENNLHVLQQTLQDQGLKVDRIYVIVQDGLDSPFSSGHSAQFGQAGSSGNGDEERGFSAAAGSASSGQPEEIAVDTVTWISLNPNSRFHTVA